MDKLKTSGSTSAYQLPQGLLNLLRQAEDFAAKMIKT